MEKIKIEISFSSISLSREIKETIPQSSKEDYRMAINNNPELVKISKNVINIVEEDGGIKIPKKIDSKEDPINDFLNINFEKKLIIRDNKNNAYKLYPVATGLLLLDEDNSTKLYIHFFDEQTILANNIEFFSRDYHKKQRGQYVGEPYLKSNEKEDKPLDETEQFEVPEDVQNQLNSIFGLNQSSTTEITLNSKVEFIFGRNNQFNMQNAKRLVDLKDYNNYSPDINDMYYCVGISKNSQMKIKNFEGLEKFLNDNNFYIKFEEPEPVNIFKF